MRLPINALHPDTMAIALRIINAMAGLFAPRPKTSFLPFKGRIKVGMGL